MNGDALTIDRPLASPSAAKSVGPRQRMSDIPPTAIVRARYDAAQTTDDNREHWAGADAYSADIANSPDVRRTLRMRSRYEAANNPICQGILATLANDTIGTGPGLQCFGLPQKALKAIESRFWEWSLAVGLPDILWRMRLAKARDGAAWVQFVTNPRLDHPLRLDLREFEDEQIADPDPTFGATRTDGIVIDDFGNPIAYKVLKQHPGDLAAVFGALLGEAELVPASQMVHYYAATRAGQHRGVPEITPALPLFAQLRQYTLAVLAAAQSAADIAGVIKSTSPNVEPEEYEAFDLIDIQRRMLMTLPQGWDINQLKAEQPTTTFAMFHREIVAEIGRALSMPYNVAAGDSSNANYSSARLDWRIYGKSIRVERQVIERTSLKRILRVWWAAAIEIDGYLPSEARELLVPPAHEWRWDGEELIDPQKEEQARTLKLQNGTTNRVREYQLMGLDIEEEDEAAARSFGVSKAAYRQGLFSRHIAPQPGAAPAAGANSSSDEDTELEESDDE